MLMNVEIKFKATDTSIPMQSAMATALQNA